MARIVTSYDDLFWRQADLIPCSHCRIKEFDRGNKSNETNETPEAVAEDAWLAVYKSFLRRPSAIAAGSQRMGGTVFASGQEAETIASARGGRKV